MGNNGFMGQLVGPFEANESLYKKITEDAHINFEYVTQIGVQTDVGSIIYINHEPIEIGKTGIYEIGNTEITSLYFDEDKDEHTIIDYIIYKSEDI